MHSSSALDRVDDVVELADERRGRVGEAAVDVDHDEGGAPAEAGAPVEPRVTHLVVRGHRPYMPSPARTRASASSPGSSGDQRSGVAVCGGSSPVSSRHRAMTSSSGGP